MLDYHNNSLAIIGMAVKFPGADNIHQYWNNLERGKESIHFFKDEELLTAGIPLETLQQANYVKAKGIINLADCFDASFFGFSAIEAEITDPQQRLFLQCAWHGLENAGYCPDTYSGLIGTYAACGNINSYFNKHIISQPDLINHVGYYQVAISNQCDFLATRTAYKLGLRGPAVTFQTACSSSLVAVHYACQDLLNYQCDMAIAGGAAISFPLYEGYLYQEGMILSPDGHCRAFSTDAQGTVKGDGVGIVVLKRLGEAIEDGDHIYAVIKGTAVNNDGHAKIGYTAPSIEGQKLVIQAALTAAQVAPEAISYIETHGTGTPLGDPIEVQALSEIFASRIGKSERCALGSVKTNIGHLDAAAGIASLIKVTLALKNKKLPPSLHCTTPSSKIDWEHNPFYVNTQLQDWSNEHGPLYAGVSSFGIGGTNAHVVLAEAPATLALKSNRTSHVLCLSAKTEISLGKLKQDLLGYLKDNANSNLADVEYTLHTGRRYFEYRDALLVKTNQDGIINDSSFIETQKPSPRIFENPQLVFMFSGQGAQYPAMGQILYRQEPVFRKNLDECANILDVLLKFDIREALCQENDLITYDINQTSFTQPLLFAFEYALAQLWISWGVQPNAMIGHSIGEYVAACLAGVFSLEGGLRLVVERGSLMQQLAPGEMLAVLANKQEIISFLPPNLDIAVENSPQQCVVAGALEEIEALKAILDRANIQWIKVKTSHAFHSRHMDGCIMSFAEAVAKTTLAAPKLPFISNLTGTWITEDQATSHQYWVDHLRKPVQFSSGVRCLIENSYNVFLEIGPGLSLTNFVNQHVSQNKHSITTIHSLPSYKERSYTTTNLQIALGKLWKSGINIQWDKYYQHQQKKRLPLPVYPFDLKRYSVVEEKLPDFATDAPGNMLYEYTWKQESLVGFEVNDMKHILLFANPIDFCERLKDLAEKDHKHVTWVEAGDICLQKSPGHYIIRKDYPEDYNWLFQKIVQQGQQMPLMIVYAWSCLPFPSLHESTKMLADCFYGLLYLVQAIGKYSYQASISLKVISRHLQKVLDVDIVNPFQALLIGHCKVIPVEYPNIDCQCIDLDGSATSNSLELGSLVYEEISNVSEHRFVAYRNNQRYVSELTLIPCQESVPTKHDFNIIPGGVYLITGGLGGIGLALALHLAKKAPVRLVLLNRTSFPDRSLWSVLEKLNPSETEKIARIQEIENSGSQVHIYQADISNEVDMQELISAIQAQLGLIRGVIHAAGQAGGGIIQHRDNKDIAQVFSAKIFGTCVLDKLFAVQELDFFILCSSLAVVLGGVGQLDYCAANAFLDKYAEYKHNNGNIKLVTSINWDRWSEVGMAVDYLKKRNLTEPTPRPFAAHAHPLLSTWGYDQKDEYTFLAELSAEQHWVLAEHRYREQYILPATAYIEMLWAAFKTINPSTTCQISNMSWLKPVGVSKNESVAIKIVFKQQKDKIHFVIYSRLVGKDVFNENAHGWIQAPEAIVPQKVDITQLHARFQDKEMFFGGSPHMQTDFLEFGAHWSSSFKVAFFEHEAFAQCKLKEQFHKELQYYELHPALLDETMGHWGIAVKGKYLPFLCESITIFQPLKPHLFSYSQCKNGFSTKEEIKKVHISIMNDLGEELIRFNNFIVKSVNI